MNKKMIMTSLLAIVGALFVVTVSLAAPITQNSVLGGVVVDTVAVGTQVKEGDSLLSVETIGGPMVAARATVNGTVTSVTVEKGAKVNVGQAVAVINDGK